MKIYRNITEIYDVRPEESSTQHVVHMGENVLNLTFRVTSPLDLRINDYVLFEAERYKLKQLVSPRRISRHEFEYTCKLFSVQYDLQDALYVLEDSTGVGVLDDTVPLFGTASFHLARILKCVREVHPSWYVGDVEEPAEGKNIVYTDMDCLEALQHLCSEFNIEYWITENTVTGNTVSLGKKKFGTPLLFKYGKGNALYELSRNNQDGRIVTKLLVKGSDRNIDSSAYGNKYLHLPNNERYVEQNTGKFGVIMGRINFPEVFPRLIHKQAGDPGSVTGVRVENGIYFIKDAFLGFEPELLPGRNLIVDFQTGQLGGLKVDANWHSGTQEYELIIGDYGLGQDVPGGVFVPAVGDLYLLSDLKMPQAYIDAAEQELLMKGQEAIAQMCEQKVSYRGRVNPLFFRQNMERIETGRTVVVEDNDIVDGSGSVELRIQSYTRGINDDLNIDIEISDTLYVSRLESIIQGLKDIKDESVIRDRNLWQLRQFAERNYLHAAEAQDMLEKILLDFSPGISPVWVRTMSILIGNENQQIMFVSSKEDPQFEVTPNFVLNNTTKVFSASTAILKHMTMGIDNTSSAHFAGEHRFWDVASYISPYLGDAETPYYLVAKCSVTLTTGAFMLQEDYTYYPGDGYYYFLIGLLSSEVDGARSFATCYGYTEILPGQMRIRQIISPDGKTYFDVANGVISGNIKIQAGSTGYANLTDAPDITGLMDAALGDLMTFLDTAFADGIISEAEAESIRIYLNVLASEKARLDSEYNALLYNPMLDGLAKTNLVTAKEGASWSLDNTYSRLYVYIEDAIDDGLITSTEKGMINSYYASYSSSLAIYSERYEEARQYIEGLFYTKSSFSVYSDSIKATVNSLRNDVDDNGDRLTLLSAEFSLYSDSITATVNSLRDDVDDNGMRLTVLEQAGYIITSQAVSIFAQLITESGDEIINSINVSTSGITIAANKVNLLGQVTFQMLNQSAQDIINGKLEGFTQGSISNNDLLVSLNGQTIISGGYIQTSMINTIDLFAAQAKIGAFNISANGWFTCIDELQKYGDVGYIIMRGGVQGTGNYTSIEFGRNLSLDWAMTTCTARILNNNLGPATGATIALYLEAAGRNELQVDPYVRSVALWANGGIFIKGAFACIRETPSLNSFTTANDASILQYYDTFIFQNADPSTYLPLYLPSRAAIESTFTYFKDGHHSGYRSFIKIQVLVTRISDGRIRIHPGASDAQLVDNNGNVYSYQDLYKGDVAEFAYHNGAWYITNIQD